ncbi:MAG: hypothetical protein D6805_03335 [Planctomycetota bacterium]|nr:MAG: hypothetical protein D6805_03335 [Planctomycetota bacterium]
MRELWLQLEPYIWSFVQFFAIVVVGFLVVSLVVRVLRGWLSNIDETAGDFLTRAARLGGRVLVLIIGLSALGVDIGPLVAGVGVTGFVVGFALKDTLSNFSAGLMLLIYRPFEKGDTIEVLGKKGVVEAIEVPVTVLCLEDGERVFVPNSKIWGSLLVNYSRKGLDG